MFYISKKHNFKNFLRNSNLKYYAAFFLILIVVLTIIIVIYKKNKNTKEIETTTESETDTTDTESSVSDSVTFDNLYKLSINVAIGQLTVYSYNKTTSDYDNIVKTMLCSVNKNIEAGEYTSSKNEFNRSIWFNTNNEFYRYCSSFTNDINFHSARYSKDKDKNSLIVSDYEALGSETDNSGISLILSDARWIYENCSYDTIIEVYSNESEELSKSITEKVAIPQDITWEPTDLSEGTPWCQTEIKSLKSVPTIELPKGATTQQLKQFCSAFDKENNNVNSYVYVSGRYNLSVPGEYNITFILIDKMGNRLSSNSSLTIKETETTSVTETTTPPQDTGGSDASNQDEKDNKNEQVTPKEEAPAE